MNSDQSPNDHAHSSVYPIAICIVLVGFLMAVGFNSQYGGGFDAGRLGVTVEMTPDELVERYSQALDSGEIPDSYEGLLPTDVSLNNRAYLVKGAEGRLGIALKDANAVTYDSMYTRGNIDLLPLYKHLASLEDSSSPMVSGPIEDQGEASPSESKVQGGTAVNAEKYTSLSPEQAKKLEALLKKRFSDMDTPEEAPSARTVDTEAISETESLVFYSDRKIPKIGFNVEEEFLNDEQTRAQVKFMLQRIEQHGDSWSVVYPAKGEHRKTIAIFGDPTCPLCQRMHDFIPDLQEMGVKVHYMFYNRNLKSGQQPNRHAKAGNAIMERVWCADDSASALSDAMQGFLPKHPDCSTLSQRGKTVFPGNEHFLMGRILNMRGTPYTITDDGRVLVGFNSVTPTPFQNYVDRLGL